MIRFQCPRCESILEAPDNRAGDKISCPKCQQRLEIPIPPPQAKTILASFIETIPEPNQAPELPPLPLPIAYPIQHSATPGDPLPIAPERPRLRLAADSDGLHIPRGFICPFCGTRQPARSERKISTAGWIMFALGLVLVPFLVGIILVIIGLSTKEEYTVCGQCGARLEARVLARVQ